MSGLRALLAVAALLASVSAAGIGPAVASAVLTLKGKVFSILPTEFVLLSDNELFHIRKDALTPEQRKRFETASTHQITIDVPLDAITRVRPSRVERPGTQ
jgi:hypothetical protein